ncbi:MAG: hypothetical protein NC917_06265 [Candidatus Omnitrophica bacterium]|nr:hypothetical protein [Candidatus Omnitrophota bacterium]MCM8808832.1 hypothetical protein [Candidatus Omnitrophota bacterium]MCM8811232.1 hypothetical protein [Candidatus Omnitrophota bacterium]
MIEGKIVKVRFKKYYSEQKLWVFIGKVLKFTENWIMLEGKGIIVIKGQVSPVEIDREKRIIIVPRENISHIRILPDDFDIDNIEVITRGLRIFVKVKNGPDTSISEI